VWILGINPFIAHLWGTVQRGNPDLGADSVFGHELPVESSRVTCPQKKWLFIAPKIDFYILVGLVFHPPYMGVFF